MATPTSLARETSGVLWLYPGMDRVDGSPVLEWYLEWFRSPLLPLGFNGDGNELARDGGGLFRTRAFQRLAAHVRWARAGPE